MSGLLVARRGGITKHRASGGGPAIALVNHYTLLTTSVSVTNVVTGVTAASGSDRVMVATCCKNVGNAAKIITGITDSGSNTWTKQIAVLGSAGNSTGVEVWTAPVTGSVSAGSVTITSTGNALDGFFDVSVWSGWAGGTILSTSGSTSTSGTSPTSAVSPTGAAAVVAGTTFSNATIYDTGPGTGWTVLGGGSSSALDYGTAAYSIKSVAGTYGPTWTRTANPAWGVATISLASL